MAGPQTRDKPQVNPWLFMAAKLLIGATIGTLMGQSGLPLWVAVAFTIPAAWFAGATMDRLFL